jgi:predicted PhzF superfamily epimerase YddE/YHI9
MLSRMQHPFYWVDAFATDLFSGNPAGVCFLQEPLEDETMRKLVDEMSLSEIAFLTPEGSGYRLRWFTPAAEIDLCGHATLASSHVIWETGRKSNEEAIRFETRSGTLKARSKEDEVVLDFPERILKPEELPPLVKDMLGPVLWSGRTERDFLAELPSADAVRNLGLDYRELGRSLESCLMVTARSDDPAFDFIVRFFAPNLGVDEDPVTGSAYCALGPYWSPKLQKGKMRAYQASKRGGIVGVEIGPSEGRVSLAGKAITLFSGEVELPSE